MLPAEFDQANFTFTKPANMTDEECASLPVFKGQDTNGLPVIISKWRFNKEDLEIIAETGEIWLQIVGDGMPPVSLYTENPFVTEDAPNK